MSVGHKILTTYQQTCHLSRLEQEDELQKTCRQLERFLFTIVNSLDLAQRTIGDQREHYIERAHKAAKAMDEWSVK